MDEGTIKVATIRYWHQEHVGMDVTGVQSSKRESRGAQLREAREAHRVNPDQRLTAEEVLEVVFGLALEERDLWE